MCSKDLINPDDPKKPVVPVKCADDPNFFDKDFEYIQNCNTWNRTTCIRYNKCNYYVISIFFGI